MKNFDNLYINNENTLLAGVDEAGRGPLAGPVVAASVIFAKDVNIFGVNDSKKLSEARRNDLYNKIIEKSTSYAIVEIGNRRIDEINILQAALEAMKISVERLKVKPDITLVDGNKTYCNEDNVKAIVKGDEKSFAIASASILAKVYRDALMLRLHDEYPMYLWKKNKGYPTKEHINAVKKYGVSPYHRITFLKKIFNGRD